MAVIDRLFLGVGAMKAGTSWLYENLTDHPDIFFSEAKEIHYFAQINGVQSPLALAKRIDGFKAFAGSLNAGNYNARRTRRQLLWYSRWLSEPLNDNWYATLFKGRRDQKYAADFSNLSALLDDDGWKHVRDVAGEVKAVYIMRNPLSRLWSHVKFHAQVVNRFDEIAGWKPDDFERFARRDHMWKNTEYGRIVAQLKRNLSEDELKLAFFEDIHAAPRDWLRELEAFLDVRPGEYPEQRLGQEVNRSRGTPMPDYVPDLFAEDFARIIGELRAQGIEPPASWTA
jgi:Sulfotransferase domain